MNLEEMKEGPPPRKGMQTRSQGPPSFGEKIQQEVYNPLGNLISKRTGYTIPNMGEYGAYDVVEGHGGTIKILRIILLIMHKK